VCTLLERARRLVAAPPERRALRLQALREGQRLQPVGLQLSAAALGGLEGVARMGKALLSIGAFGWWVRWVTEGLKWPIVMFGSGRLLGGGGHLSGLRVLACGGGCDYRGG
jgi:hypothetical protein